MPKALTNQIIDERLINRNIVRLGNFINVYSKIEWKCTTCNYIWLAKPNSVISGLKSGCAKCSGNHHLKNDYIDSLLNKRSVKRIGSYVNNFTPITFKCLLNTCNYTWETSTSSILNRNSGCPKCAGVVKYSNKEIDNKLFNINIKKLNPYVNMVKSNKFQCINCNYIWTTSTNNILNNKSRCPKCSNRVRLTNEDIDFKLSFKKIKRLDNYLNNHSPIRFQCLIDDYIWKTTSKSIFGLNSGCPKCSNVAKLTNEEVDSKLINRGIVRIDSVINSSTPINFKCQKCTYIWLSAPNDIRSGKGCPKCNTPGINEKLMLQSLDTNNIRYKLHYCIKKIDLESPSYTFDAYIENIRLAIEYNGKQHYEPTGFGSGDPELTYIKQKERDDYKREFCKKHKIILIEIDGRVYYGNKLKIYLVNELIPMLKGLEEKCLIKM